MIEELVKLADYLDQRGLSDESNFIDDMISKVADNTDAPNVDSSDCRALRVRYSTKRHYIRKLAEKMEEYTEYTSNQVKMMQELSRQIESCKFAGNKRFLTPGELQKEVRDLGLDNEQ